MNEIIEDLHRRKSVRVFTEQEITQEQKREILYAAMAALRRMFEKECRTQSFEEWAKRFCIRKYNSVFLKEMSRSVGVWYIWRPSPERKNEKNMEVRTRTGGKGKHP